jgi:hypothetical protein
MKSVTEKAVMARINRKLSHQGEVLRKLRGERWFTSLGEYFVVDSRSNAVIDTHVVLEALAREIGVLNDFEGIQEAG